MQNADHELGLTGGESSLLNVLPVMAEPNAPFMQYSTCCAADFFHPEFHRLCSELGVGFGYHRKVWEWVFIAHHLRTVSGPGTWGLGFGVGGEPMPAFLAKAGAAIVATDAPEEIGVASGWLAGDQLAQGMDSMPSPNMDRQLFERLVAFRRCDMNAISPKLRDFDFCWSSCALEHLGSLQAGLDFVTNSLATLKPGGLAVHTTEFNLSSDWETIEDGPCVLYRRRDIQALVDELVIEGHEVAPFLVAPNTMVMDDFVDLPPYSHAPHLKLMYEGHVTTSIGLVVRKKR